MYLYILIYLYTYDMLKSLKERGNYFMNKKIFTLSSSLLATTMFLTHNPIEASVEGETELKNDAIEKVSETFHYQDKGLRPTGEVEDKGSYYIIPTYQSTGVGGIKIIKVDKSNGQLLFGDKDANDFKTSGTLKLDDYKLAQENNEITTPSGKQLTIEKDSEDKLPESGESIPFQHTLYSTFVLMLGISIIMLNKFRKKA